MSFSAPSPNTWTPKKGNVVFTYHPVGSAPLSDPSRHEWAATAFAELLGSVAVASGPAAASFVAFVEAVGSVPAFEVAPVEIAVGAEVAAASPWACLDSCRAVAFPVAVEIAPACFATVVVVAAIAECSCLAVAHIGST